MWHIGVVVTTIASEQEGPGLDSGRVSAFYPSSQSKDMPLSLVGYSELIVGVDASLHGFFVAVCQPWGELGTFPQCTPWIQISGGRQ